MNGSNGSRFDTRYSVGALLAVVAFGVYLSALRNGFAYDDVVVVAGDIRVTEFRLWELLTGPYWAAPGMGLYRPLVTLSFAVDWALSDGSTTWFHAMNGLWHAAATVALYSLLLAWFGVFAAAAGALVFAVHPVHVEAVANIVGRAELMAALFVLLACVLWAHERPRSSGLRVLMVCVSFALAMLCKESAAVLPGLLVLIDATRHRWNNLGELPAYLRRNWRLYGSLTVVLIGVLGLRIAVTGVLSPSQVDPILEIMGSPAERIRTSMQVWPHYLRLLLFPRTLLADYGPRVLMPLDSGSPLILYGVLVLGTLLIGGLLLLNRRRPLAALMAWWLPLTVLPVANLLVPIGILLAERTLYLPSAAVSLLIAMLVSSTRGIPTPWRRPAALSMAGVLLLAVVLGTVRTRARIPDWRTTDTILMAQLRDRPDSFRGHWHAARIERRRNNVSKSLDHYGYALYLWPYREQLLVDAAAFASAHGRTGQALQWATFGAQRLPESTRLHKLVAANALDAGDTATASAAVRNALRIAPDDSLAQRLKAAIDSARTP